MKTCTDIQPVQWQKTPYPGAPRVAQSSVTVILKFLVNFEHLADIFIFPWDNYKTNSASIPPTTPSGQTEGSEVCTLGRLTWKWRLTDPRHRWNKRVGDCQEGSGCTCALTITEGWQPTLDFQVLLRGNSQTEKEQLGNSKELQDWRCGSAIRITGCSSRGPQDSQHPHGCSQRLQLLFQLLWHGVHSEYRHAGYRHMQAKEPKCIK